MTINNEKELKLFESTIESCTDPVWLVSNLHRKTIRSEESDGVSHRHEHSA